MKSKQFFDEHEDKEGYYWKSRGRHIYKTLKKFEDKEDEKQTKKKRK